MRRQFTVEHNGKKHVIVAMASMSGREVVSQDGRELVNKMSFSFRSLHVIPIPGRDVKVRMALGSWLMPKATLLVDGVNVDETPVPGVTAASVAAVPLPPWGYAFVGACVLIPILSRGGAIPGALGAGAAAGCVSVLQGPGSTGMKAAKCAGITVVAYVLFGALIAAATRART